jgi:hypothetical protein
MFFTLDEFREITGLPFESDLHPTSHRIGAQQGTQIRIIVRACHREADPSR